MPTLFCTPSIIGRASPLIPLSYNKLHIPGGIRCVKINAYLEQVLGFTNVSRLAGGIISYTRELELEKEKSNVNLLDTNNGSKENNELKVDMNSDVNVSDKLQLKIVNENESENENEALTMISKSIGENTLLKEDSPVVKEHSNEEELGIHLSRNLLGSKFKVLNTV